jgi:hypothetical protein
MLDLFAIARANADAVHAAFESTVAGLPEAKAAAVREFAAWVEAEALISINDRLYIVVELLTGGRYQTVHEWAREEASLTGQAVEDILRQRLGSFYHRRVAFDGAFKDGETFHYGTLNAGGAGLPKYGSYCLVLTRTFQSALPQVAYLPGDTLRVCFSADGQLDHTKVKALATPHSHRHEMVATRRAAGVVFTPKPDWPDLVIRPGQCFEAVFVGEVVLQGLDCVRVAKAEYDRMWALTFASCGAKPGDAERALMHDFRRLLIAKKDNKVNLEVVG